jgi:hypothetical protein
VVQPPGSEIFDLTFKFHEISRCVCLFVVYLTQHTVDENVHCRGAELIRQRPFAA